MRAGQSNDTRDSVAISIAFLIEPTSGYHHADSHGLIAPMDDFLMIASINDVPDFGCTRDKLELKV
jgi:hypothetical protein